MFSAFKKKEDRPQNGSEKKSFSLEELESELNVLNKTDLSKVEGGKDTKKSLTDISGLRNSMGGTIPLWTNYTLSIMEWATLQHCRVAHLF